MITSWNNRNTRLGEIDQRTKDRIVFTGQLRTPQIALDRKQPYKNMGDADADSDSLVNYIKSVLDRGTYFDTIETDEDLKNTPVHRWDHNESKGFNNQDSYGIRYDLMPDLRPLVNEWNAQRTAKPAAPGETYDSFLREIEKLISADKERLGKMPKTTYEGKTPKMSMMTQRALALEQAKHGKSGNYQKKIDNLNSRESRGFDDSQIQGLGDILSRGANSANENIFQKLLKNEFKDNFQEDRINRFNAGTNQDISQDAAANRPKFGRFSDDLKHIQKNNTKDLTDTFKTLGKAKDTRGLHIIDELKKMGNQQHVFDEIADLGDRKTHDLEAMLPYSKLSQLEKQYQNAQLEPGNPNAEKNAREHLNGALAKYGVLTEKPNFKHWDQNRIKDANVLTDNLTEDLPAAVLESQYTMQRLDPNFKGSKHGEVKSLRNELKDNVFANDVYNKTAAGIGDEISTNLDPELERQAEGIMNRIANKYMRLNQYGSPQQIRESENALRELNRSYMPKRSDILDTSLRHSTGDINRELEGKRRDLLGFGQRNQEDFDTIMGNIRNKNSRGAEEWGNAQNEKNKKTDAYLNNLRFDDIYQPSGSKFQSYTNPFDQSNFNQRITELQSRRPTDPMGRIEDLDLDRLNRTAYYNNSDKADNTYARTNAGHLKETNQYQPQQAQDAMQSKSEYDARKQAAASRKSEIERKSREDREKALRTAAEAALNDGLITNPQLLAQIEVALKKGDIQSLEQLADILEKNTTNKFALRSRPTGLGWNKVKYHPTAYNEIKSVALEQLKPRKMNYRSG